MASNYGGPYLFAGPGDIGEHKIVSSTVKSLSIQGFSLAKAIPAGSVLFTCIGYIGRCGIAVEEMATNQQINAVLPSREVVGDFMYYALSFVAPGIRATAAEQVVPIVNKAQFGATSLIVPPLPEQRAIAEALSDVDALIAALDALIAKKRAVKTAAMQQLLTGRQRLPGFSGEWREKRLTDVAALVPGTYLPKTAYRPGRFVIEGAGSPMGTHVVPSIPKPLTVVGKVGTVGNPRFYPSGCWVNNNAAALVADQAVASPFFLHEFVSTLNWPDHSSVTAQPFLNGRSLMNVSLPLPPLEEQQAVATILSDMDAEIAALEARRDKTRHIKTGMMQELLTGRTRLIPHSSE